MKTLYLSDLEEEQMKRLYSKHDRYASFRPGYDKDFRFFGRYPILKVSDSPESRTVSVKDEWIVLISQTDFEHVLSGNPVDIDGSFDARVCLDNSVYIPLAMVFQTEIAQV